MSLFSQLCVTPATPENSRPVLPLKYVYPPPASVAPSPMPRLARRFALYAPTGMSPVTYVIQLLSPFAQAKLAYGYKSVPPVTESLRVRSIPGWDNVRSTDVRFLPGPHPRPI